MARITGRRQPRREVKPRRVFRVPALVRKLALTPLLETFTPALPPRRAEGFCTRTPLLVTRRRGLRMETRVDLRAMGSLLCHGKMRC